MQFKMWLEALLPIKRRRYFVYIPKAYFPPRPDPRVVAEDYEQWNILATSRQEAARIAWQTHGERLLKLMKPKQSTVRKISLFVSNPETRTPAGRLMPIQVHIET